MYQGDPRKSCIDLISTQYKKWKTTGDYLPHNSECDEQEESSMKLLPMK